MTEPLTPPHMRLDNQICFAIHSAAHAFAQAYKPLLEPLGLTYPQYLVMLLLWEKDDRSVSELGAPLFLDSGTLTPLLKRLQTQGLIDRNRDAKDERVMRITLTEAGKALTAKATEIPAAMFCLFNMEGENLVQMRDQVKALGQALRQTA
ncbi:MarR family winged helix-turn-helix transcriptional regulator [Asticcacaulis sp. YBE204]|uniref:MarR family winged helix-turn-helix transcriptional regulator n=1 Tax=Asticcacaulis sp. YBE204 TaxID=1282363 RepID=UPI0003C3E9B3|nr:MarR family transcriptional regulator [Asticcacaulis sp. YBE204]ESQ78070.1 MarR family transcriptional regulator [Asticcacaulis sp. YBE204]